MGKKFFGLALSTLLFAHCFSAQAQQAQKVYRVGILRSGSPSSYLYGPQHDVIRQGLRTLGYIEGSNLLIEYRYAENKLDRLPELARELVGLTVDILVISPSSLTIRAALEASRTIPIVVMGATIDPVQMGFAKSLARPGGNITGLTNLDTELHGKRLGCSKKRFRQFPAWRSLLVLSERNKR